MRQAGLSVAHPIAHEQDYVLDIPAPEGIRYALLYAESTGVSVGQRITPEQASMYGHLVARIHEVADAQSLQAPRRIDLDYLLDEPARLIVPLIRHRPHDLQWLEQSIEDLKRAVSTLPRTQPTYGLCHGDLHKSNILCQSDGQLTLVDWDCVGMGWRAYDLSILRWSIGPAVGKEGIGEPRLSEVWSAYLNSYQGLRSLSNEERVAIPAFVAIRHIRALGWGIDRAVNGIDGYGRLTDEYFDWWFDGLRTWQGNGATSESLERTYRM